MSYVGNRRLGGELGIGLWWSFSLGVGSAVIDNVPPVAASIGMFLRRNG